MGIKGLRFLGKMGNQQVGIFLGGRMSWGKLGSVLIISLFWQVFAQSEELDFHFPQPFQGRCWESLELDQRLREAEAGEAPTTEQECTAIDQTKKLGSVRAQGNVGWCFAHVGADLISHHFGVSQSYRISASMIAMLFNFNSGRPLKSETGNVDKSMYYSLRPYSSTTPIENIGFCSEEKIDRYFQKGDSIQGRLTAILNLKTQIELIGLAKMKDFALVERAAVSLPELDSGKVKEILDSMQKKKDPLLFGDRLFLVKVLWETPGEQAVINLIHQVCGKDKLVASGREPRPIRWGWKREWTLTQNGQPKMCRIDFDMYRELNQQLNSGNVLGLNYNARFILKEKIKDDVLPDPQEFPYWHASVIVGRKWMNSTVTGKASCHYLIRNSWGASCQTYSRFVEGCNENPGHFYVAEEILKKYATNIYFLPKSDGMSSLLNPWTNQKVFP